MASLDISQQEYEQMRSSGMSKEQIVAQYSKKPSMSVGKAVTKFGQGATNLAGLGGLADQFTSSLARTGLRLSGNKEAAKLVKDPSIKRVAGSLLQTGANFIPGVAGKALIPKVIGGAATGYAFDVAGGMQANEPDSQVFKPGIGTAVGAGLPILGKIIGLTTKNLPAAASRKLEETSLRLTPVERQNLEKKGQDISKYLATKKVVGTPQMRFAKVSKLYDQMENLIQNKIKTSGTVYQTGELIDDLAKLPDQFVDDPELASEAGTVVNKLITNLQSRGGTIDASSVNALKRNYMDRAFAKNATDVVSDSRLAVGALLNGKLRGSIKGLEALNKEYGYIIASRRALSKALSRPQIGLVGKLTGITAGTAIGSMIGGGAGAAAGAVAGPTVGKTIAGTLPRSAVGAGLQTISEIASKVQSLPTDRLGNVSQKAVLSLLQNLKLGQ